MKIYLDLLPLKKTKYCSYKIGVFKSCHRNLSVQSIPVLPFTNIVLSLLHFQVLRFLFFICLFNSYHSNFIVSSNYINFMLV